MVDRVETQRVVRATPQQLKELRTLTVAVIHPDDSDGRQLTQQLQRIGCKVQAFWPPVQSIGKEMDVVFLAVRPEIINLNMDWAQADDAPTVIAVVNYENPTIVELVLGLEAKAVLPSPVRSFGLLSTLVLARESHKVNRALARRLKKVEAKLLGVRHIADAKAVLMKTHQVSETEAYDVIRDQAMAKRTTTEEVARAIVEAHELLSLSLPSRHSRAE
ncbi:MAG: ANTAR domain-containing protein [Thiobacillus sp.]|jgi:AmiR/NasT family two-component response regulator|uniref:ANTAR domain-containing response regulator n=1 Tax=Hydrogenophaga taeniospiralis TaxID=65656 RepID=UPI001CFB23B6|nr:ANTAR domain-containing protein [Hydrogenophaga taeniospiralis]MBW8468805.1 ANTAR domain-containing protein [Thiobacillus sp.]MDZ4291387.1 ANTAR domain-containing protein [Hydrogenophaga sp.]UCU94992.1 ANTAR domain-containing protein [Hydrogenophaga taeniospiralis]